MICTNEKCHNHGTVLNMVDIVNIVNIVNIVDMVNMAEEAFSHLV